MRREHNTGAALPDGTCIQHDRRSCHCQSARERAGRFLSPDDSVRSENAQGTESTLVGASSHRIESASTGIPVSPSGPTFPRMRSDLESSAEAAVVPRLHRAGSIEIRHRTSCRSHAVDTLAQKGAAIGVGQIASHLFHPLLRWVPGNAGSVTRRVSS
jgi:hypothetical protein